MAESKFVAGDKKADAYARYMKAKAEALLAIETAKKLIDNAENSEEWERDVSEAQAALKTASAQMSEFKKQFDRSLKYEVFR
jgi:hypothetical protein